MSTKSIAHQIKNLEDKIQKNKANIADLEQKITQNSVAFDFGSVNTDDFIRECNVDIDILIQKDMHMQKRLAELYRTGYSR